MVSMIASAVKVNGEEKVEKGACEREKGREGGGKGRR
eukprot:COSAG05_NODE_19608_length_290_cov_0.806283_1_plen_36_part_10